MPIKIKEISIEGFRGIQKKLNMSLLEKSILLYGDNGSGKSSITDSLEWYFNNDVRHLAGSEIDLKEALRNSNLSDTDISSIEIAFTKSDINSSRRIYFKKNKLVSEFANESEKFVSYLKQTQTENLFLRFQFLTDFIDKTKADKLKSLSDVIGFAEVNKVNEVLKKAYNSIKAEIKNQNFEAQINTQKEIQIEKIGASIGVERNLFDKVEEIINPLKLGVTINSFKDINTALDLIQTQVNTEIVNKLRFLENCKNTMLTLKSEVDFISIEYHKYYSEFQEILKDIQSIIQIYFTELLQAGSEVIEKKYHKDDTCPLCLQPISRTELLKDIQRRLNQIEELSKKKASFDSKRQTVIRISEERIKRLKNLKEDELYDDIEFEEVKEKIEFIIQRILAYKRNGDEKVTSGNGISLPEVLKLDEKDFEFVSLLSSKIDSLKAQLKKDNPAEIFSNISAARDAFLRVKRFEKERSVLEQQKKSMEIIYNEFVKKQKEGLENFISTFSGSINEYYQYMNPNEQFQELKIVTIGIEDELNGITIKYKYNGEWVSPPQKYFSESHLNCFGLSFFLASVKAFNKENRFILLDDVISSFDSNHRRKFADLLFEKFSDYQIILMTHEKEWFQYVSQLAKRKSWLVNEIKWSDTDGAILEEKPADLKELIEIYLSQGNVDLLGNPMRKYLEHILKEICFNLNVKVKFRYNSDNEKRMADELLCELKSKIDKSSTTLKAQNQIIGRIINSNILGNLLSHDNPFSAKIGDLKAFWSDLKDFERLFFCDEIKCNTPVSFKNYDTVKKEIRCSCGKLVYDWKT